MESEFSEFTENEFFSLFKTVEIVPRFKGPAIKTIVVFKMKGILWTV